MLNPNSCSRTTSTATTSIPTKVFRGKKPSSPFEMMLFKSDDFSEEEDLSVNVSDDTIEEYFNTIDTSTLIEFEEEITSISLKYAQNHENIINFH